MNPRTLDAYLRSRGWTQAELARRIGLSRQAVSRWFQSAGDARVRGDHLLAVSRALDVPVEHLVAPLPGIEDDEGGSHTALLWDGLYPSLVDFAIAAGRFEPRAVGRFVEVYGMFAAAKVLGPCVWTDFEEFARFIHPARRRQLATLVKWQLDRTAA